jgi:hypothetical protein
MRLQPVYDTLDELLQRRLFTIPDYQRAYSWNPKQRNDLFGDIMEILVRDDDRHHFMATIVCLKKPGKEEVGTQEYRTLDVVDGQQRITTLIILLKAISKELHDGGAIEKDEAAQIEKLLVKDEGRLILLQTTDSTRWLLDITGKLVQLQKDPRRRSVTIITQARLLACAILLTDSLTPEEKEKSLEQWERVTFRIYGLCDKDSRTLVGDYTSLAHRVLNKGIRNYTQLMSQLRVLGKKFPVDEAVECIRKGNCYEGWETHARYMLCRYEEHLAKEHGAVIKSDMWQQIWSASAAKTIEHIYPETPGKGWGRKGFRHDDDVHRLGNLMRLPPGVNSEAGNKTFADKKAIYKKNYLRMMDDVLAEDDWNKDAMEHREDKMLEWAKQQWDDIEP